MILLLLTILVTATFLEVSANVGQAHFETSSTSVRLREVLTPEIKGYIQETIKNEGIPGLSVGVVRRDSDEIEMEGFGYSTEDGDPVTPDTLFFIASCSKAFLTASLGMLMDDYQHARNTTPLPQHLSSLNWSTKVRDLIPDDWKLRDPWATEQASLGDILSHKSGMYSHDYSYSPTGSSPRSVVQNLRYLKPKFEFREAYEYNNLMFITAAHIMNLYTKDGFISYVTERILKPLGMNSTTYIMDEAHRSGLLSQTWDNGRLFPHAFSNESAELSAGPGGIASNARDMTRWLKVLLSEGRNPDTGSQVIPAHVISEVTYPRTIATAVQDQIELTPSLYCLGWEVDYYQGHKKISHFGGIPGFLSSTIFYPHDGLGIFVIYNTANSNAIATMHYKLADVALGLHTPSWVTDKHGFTSSSPTPTTQPMTDTDLEGYVGRYSQVAYGSVELCNLQSDSHPDTCNSIRQVFASANITEGLAASWNKIWTQHIHARPIAEEICILPNQVQPTDTETELFARARCLQSVRLRLLTIFPHGYGKDTSPFTTVPADVMAVFLKSQDGGVIGYAALDGVNEKFFNSSPSVEEIAKKAFVAFGKD